MSAATKVSIAVVVLFAVVLGVYYGFGRPAGLDPVPDPEVTPGSTASTEQLDDPRPAIGSQTQSQNQAQNRTGLINDTAGAAPSDNTVLASDMSRQPVDDVWVLRAPVVTDQGGPVADERYDEYFVRDGDSMWTIAADLLGSGTRWPEIADANPQVNADRLNVGDRLRVPAADASSPPGGTVALNTAAAIQRPVPGARPQPAVRTPVRPTGRTYTVRSGDTLTSIAKQQYRTANRWRTIWDANRAAIGQDPDRLKVGMKLRIP